MFVTEFRVTGLYLVFIYFAVFVTEFRVTGQYLVYSLQCLLLSLELPVSI